MHLLYPFGQYTVNGLTIGAFYALVALGYTIVYGIVRLINFPHGDLAAVGSFVGLTTFTTATSIGLPPLLAVVCALLVPMSIVPLLMVAVFRIVYRPMLKRKAMLGLLIAALGVSVALENSLQLIYGAAPEAYPNVLPQVSFAIGRVHITVAQIGLFAICIGLMVALQLFVKYTSIGVAMRALAQDHDAARLVGINVDFVIAVAFGIGASLAAASGVMIGLYYGQITFLMGFLLGLKAFTAAVVGGIGNIPGAMLGGLVIGLLESYCTGYLSGRWQDVFVFGVLILVLVVRPAGLLGERVAARM